MFKIPNQGKKLILSMTKEHNLSANLIKKIIAKMVKESNTCLMVTLLKDIGNPV